MTHSDHVNRVQNFLTRLNQGDLESIRAFIAPEFFTHKPKPGETTGTEVYYDLVSDIKKAVSGLQIAVSDLQAEGELLKGRLSLKGTHDGPLWGAPASGNYIAWEADLSVRPIKDRYAINLDNVTMPNLIGVLRQMYLMPESMDQPSKYPVSLPEPLLKVTFTGQMADKPCSHLEMIQVTEPSTDVCEQCVAAGDIWPALRMCLVCGFVGCCDTSKNKHMKQHYEQTGHPIFRSIRLGEGWVWCYEDNAFFSKSILER